MRFIYLVQSWQGVYLSIGPTRQPTLEILTYVVSSSLWNLTWDQFLLWTNFALCPFVLTAWELPWSSERAYVGIRTPGSKSQLYHSLGKVLNMPQLPHLQTGNCATFFANHKATYKHREILTLAVEWLCGWKWSDSPDAVEAVDKSNVMRTWMWMIRWAGHWLPW